MESSHGLTSIDLSTRSTANLVHKENEEGDYVEGEIFDKDEWSLMRSVLPSAFAGVIAEYRLRWPHMMSSDYTDFFSARSKSLSASIFMFLATVFSTIALGAHLNEVGKFGEYIGVGEYLIMNSVSGLYFSITSCQPLMIIRPTGPITLIIENIILISEKYSINFWHLLACTGYFVGLWMVLVAAFEGSNKVALLTRFTHEIFGFYVCSIYIFNGVNDVVLDFETSSEENPEAFGKSIFMAVMAVVAFAISLILSTFSSDITDNKHRLSCDKSELTRKESILNDIISSLRSGKQADRKFMWSILSSRDETLDESVSLPPSAPCVDIKWNIFSVSIRSLLTDYAVTIAVVLVTCLSYVPFVLGHSDDDVVLDVSRVRVPTGMSPTMEERTWLVSFASQPYQTFYSIEVTNSLRDDDTVIMVLMSFAISIPIVFFFYIDQNLSCTLSQAPHIEGMEGGKGTYVHSPFLCVAITNLIGPSFGLPFVTASLPHSPQFVLALSDSRHEKMKKDINDSDEVEDFHGNSSITENRVAPILVYVLIGLVAFYPSFVRCIPLGAVRGILAFVGYAGILNTELYHRIVCMFKPYPGDLLVPSLSPGLEVTTVRIPFYRIHLYTLLQVSVLILFWGLNFSPQPAGLLVAFVVAALGPVRLYVLPRIFLPEELAVLD